MKETNASQQHADLSKGTSTPLSYHGEIRDYLRSQEAEVWNWYASNRIQKEQSDALKFDLLKSTYRLSREKHEEIYSLADEVADQLELGAPITIYQAQNPEGLNASLAFAPGEAHIILHGDLTTKLSPPELRALLAHELGHMLLYENWEGEFLVTEQILSALTLDRQADTPHFASARLFRLFSEVFCDRVALRITEDSLVVVSMLVKVLTGLNTVDPAGYLNQAQEVLRAGNTGSEGVSHPEAYLRAYALQLWQELGSDAEETIRAMIEGRPSIDKLDLTAQVKLTQVTRDFVSLLLAPRWMRSPLNLAHSRLFFDDLRTDELDLLLVQETRCQFQESIRVFLQNCDKSLHTYLNYVLLDFATADRELEEAPLAHAIQLAENIGLGQPFYELVGKELKLRKKQLAKIRSEKDSIIKTAELEEVPHEDA